MQVTYVPAGWYKSIATVERREERPQIWNVIYHVSRYQVQHGTDTTSIYKKSTWYVYNTRGSSVPCPLLAHITVAMG